jgi:hypothetical protein
LHTLKVQRSLAGKVRWQNNIGTVHHHGFRFGCVHDQTW